MKTKLLCMSAIGLLFIFASVATHAESATAPTTIGDQMPDPKEYTGLSHQVIKYSQLFKQTVEKMKEPGFSDANWAPLESLVDTANFKRMGVFLTPVSEVIGWNQYKKYITQYAGGTSWEGTLRRITEVPGLVILELEERNTNAGKTNISNTVTIYKFNDANKLIQLDVYVMPLHP